MTTEPELLIQYECPACGHVQYEVWTSACDSECKACGEQGVPASDWVAAATVFEVAAGMLVVMDCSTEHISPAVADLLEGKAERRDAEVESLEHGFLIAVPRKADEWALCGEGCEELISILAKARGMGTGYILMDRDGLVHDDLPVFEW